MKKFLIVLSLFVLTGCTSKLVCTIETDEEIYESQIDVVFEFKKDKIVNAYSTNIMTFKTREDAQKQLESFGVLDEGYSVIPKNEYQLELKVLKEYESYNNSKEKIIDEFKNKGYLCN